MSYSAEIDAGSVLTNRGLNGIYGGQGNFLGDGSAVNANVIANRDQAISESINRTGSDRAISSLINQGNEFLTDRISGQSIDFKFAAVDREFSDLSRQMYSAQLEQQRANADLAAAVAKNLCCCEKNEAKIDALVALNDKDTQIQTLQLQLALGGNGRGNGNGNGGN